MLEDDKSHEDVQDLLTLAAKTGAIHSKLFNADTLWRNDYIARFLKEHGCTKILDTPCGRAPICRIISNLFEEGKLRYTGIDTWQTSTKEACNLNSVVSKSRFLVGDVNEGLNKILSSEKDFDAVLCLEGPEHFEKGKIENIFREIKELMRSGSFLIVSTPRLRNDGKLQHPHCHNWEMKIEEWLDLFVKKLDLDLFNYFGYRIRSVLDFADDPNEEYYLEDILDVEDRVFWNRMMQVNNHQIPPTSYARLIPQFLSLKQEYANYAQNVVFIFRKK